MKINRLLAGVAAGCILLSGCSKSHTEISNGDSSIQEISDPMIIPDGDDSQPQTSLSMSYGIRFTREDVMLKDNKLIVSPKLMGDESPAHVGLMIFVDGVRQKYSTENSSDMQYMSGFDIDADSEKTYDLTVDATVDGDLDDHFVSVISMLAPEYVPPQSTPRFGFYHKVLSTKSVQISDSEENELLETSYKILNTDNAVLTQEQMDKFGLGDDEDTGYVTSFELYQGDDVYESNYKMGGGENSLDLTLCAYSTDSVTCDYRVSVYVNHNQVNFNGDFDYIDVKMEGSKITETQIRLENISIGDYIYCVAVPLSSNSLTKKSSSKMVINGENSASNNPITDSGPTSDTNSESTSDTNSGSNLGTASEMSPDTTSAAVSGESTVNTSERLIPAFSIGDSLYVRRFSDRSLCRINSNGEIENTLQDGYDATIHGDKISVVTRGQLGDMYSAEDNTQTGLSIYDKNFSLINSTQINEAVMLCDFDENKIVYSVTNDNNCTELRLRDWDQNNSKTLIQLDETAIFTEIKLADGFIAFSVSEDINGKTADYYGVCDYSGDKQILRKDGVDKVQVLGKTALWCDQNVNVFSGEVPSGNVIIYENGQFETIKTQNAVESQSAFLTTGDEFVTFAEGYSVLRVYKSGTMVCEIPLDKSENITAAIRMGDTIVGSCKTNSWSLKYWELN